MRTKELNTQEKGCLQCGGLFIPERSTKKYCSDSCKQNAFYQRAALNSDQEKEKMEPLLKAANILNDINEAVSMQKEQPFTYSLPLNDSPDNNKTNFSGGNQSRVDFQKAVSFPESLTVVNDEKLTLNADSHKSTTPTLCAENYEGVRSPFIDAIAYTVDEGNEIISMLICPPARWSSRQSEAVKNINIRLRCLIENLLLLNRQPLISRSVIKAVSAAFAAMAASPSFKNLPPEYPYKDLIGKLGQQCSTVTTAMKKGIHFKLRLAVNSKVQLISTRFIISSVTPLVSFHDIDFTV